MRLLFFDRSNLEHILGGNSRKFMVAALILQFAEFI
jgi:hypothetical protein